MAKKFRVKWRRYFDNCDIKKSYSDSSPGLIYNRYQFHSLLNFRVFKKYSKKSLFKPYSNRYNNNHHRIKYKYEESKYNTEIVFQKIFKSYQDFDYVVKSMIEDRVQYVPLVDLFFEMRAWFRVDIFISLQKNWDEFMSDSFLEFYQELHPLYDDTLGVSYQTYFDTHMFKIFFKHYVINRDKDDLDIRTEMYRQSWLHHDELSYSENICDYSYYLKSRDPYYSYIKDKEEENYYQLDPHLAFSQDFLDMS